MPERPRKVVRRGRPSSLVSQLGQWFDKPSGELPSNLQDLLKERWGIPTWNSLTAVQRRRVAIDLDAQHPVDLVARQTASRDFRNGFKKISVPRRNRQNAGRQRPSRQKLSKDDIVRIRRAVASLTRRGMKVNASKVYGIVFPGHAPFTLRAFRDQWNKFAPGKKGS